MPRTSVWLLTPLLLVCGRYIATRLDYFGAFRTHTKSIAEYVGPDNFFIIPEIIQAEDMAVHEPSGLIILLAQATEKEKYEWWPAWAVFEKPEQGLTARARLWALDTTSWKPTEIKLDLDIPFTVHGIDIWTTRDDKTFYLHAVNHPPALVDGKPTDQAESRVEIFKVSLENMIAKHEQTVLHPLIKRPNDIISLGPAEFLVTNDHHHSRGILRSLEDFLDLSLASWTNIVHIEAPPRSSEPTKHAQVVFDTSGKVSGKVVASRLHNANGLGHGRNGEIILGDASGGVITTFKWNPHTRSLVDSHRINVQVNLDNPVWFDDPFATPQSNASGYLLAGLLSGIHLDKQARDINARIPSSVYLTRERNGLIETKLLFEDDGEFMSGAATAVIVPIKPSGGASEGKREGWVVVTGPWSRGVGIAKVDFTDWAKV